MSELPASFLDSFTYTEQSVVAKDVECLTSIVYLIHSMVVRIHICLDGKHILQREHGVAVCVEHLVKYQCSPIRVERDFGIMISSQCPHDVKNPFLKVFLLDRKLFFGQVFLTHFAQKNNSINQLLKLVYHINSNL